MSWLWHSLLFMWGSVDGVRAGQLGNFCGVGVRKVDVPSSIFTFSWFRLRIEAREDVPALGSRGSARCSVNSKILFIYLPAMCAHV